VTRSEEDTTRGLPRADDVRHGRRREDTVLSYDEVHDAVARCDLDNLLDALGRVESTISSDDERRALRTGAGDTFEDGLYEVLRVVFLLEDDNSGTGSVSSERVGGSETSARTSCGDQRYQACGGKLIASVRVL
jgi:hypothetical protein